MGVAKLLWSPPLGLGSSEYAEGRGGEGEGDRRFATNEGGNQGTKERTNGITPKLQRQIANYRIKREEGMFQRSKSNGAAGGEVELN